MNAAVGAHGMLHRGRMRRNHPLPQAIASRPFSVREAAELGVGAGRLRGNDLSRPFHGTRMNGNLAPETPKNPEFAGIAGIAGIADLAAAYATRMPPDQYFSHWTAAVLLGLRLPEVRVPRVLDVRVPRVLDVGVVDVRVPRVLDVRMLDVSMLDVSVPSPRRAPRLRGVRGHELLSSVRKRTLPSGLRVSDAVETWCQLAAELSLDDLIVMGDGLVCRHAPSATVAELTAAVAEWGARPGGPALRRALLEIRCRTDSARETMLRLIIVRARLPEPVVNFAICNRFGVVIGLGDLAYPSYRVLLEYDGGQHRSDERQFHIDIARLDAFMEEKWRVIRVNKSLMQQPSTLLNKVRTALEAGGWAATRSSDPS
jgi:very-short-patch-repair endonuclease